MSTTTVAKPTAPLRRQRPSISTRGTYKADALADANSENAQPLSEPHVRTTNYILKKFEGRKPSLVVHLHPTFFRFDQQEGTFSYKSEMRVFLDHVGKETVPHELIDEFLKSGVTFYDGCLIVEIRNHRNKEVKAAKKSDFSDSLEGTVPFSIHNYNEHVTPSPYVPYPRKAEQPPTKKFKTSPEAEETEKERKDKLDMPAPDIIPKKDNGPQIFTTVLHPTTLSRHHELMFLATTPIPDTKGRKGSTSREPATPGSAMPQTPSTPSAGRGASNKSVKMYLEEKDFHSFEADYLLDTEPPLYLDVPKNAEEAQRALETLAHPLHSSSPPSGRTRKRTQADMAADDAQIAREEHKMLIMDERVKPSVGAAAAAEGQAGTSAITFSRFKSLETIKQRHEEKERQRKEDDAKAVLQKRRAEAEMAQQRKLMEEQQRRAAAEAQSQQQQAQQQALLRQQAIQAQKQQMPNGMPQQMNAMAANQQQQMLQQQAAMNHSSPIVRNQTPAMNSSPMVPNANLMQGGYPMQNVGSNQGAGSPPRPSSAMHHPNVGMTRQVSQQQHPSRIATPQNAGATPHLAASVPMDINRQMTSTPMNQGSPAQNMQGTPNSNMINMQTPQMANANMTQQQQQQMMLARRQAMMQGQMQANQNMSPEQQMQMRQLAQAGAGNPQAYQAYLHQMRQNQSAQNNAQMQAIARQRAAMSSAGGMGSEAMTQTASQTSHHASTPGQQVNGMVGTPGGIIPQQQQNAMMAAMAAGNQQDPAMMERNRRVAMVRQKQQQAIQTIDAQTRQRISAVQAQHGGQAPQHMQQQILQQRQQNIAQINQQANAQLSQLQMAQMGQMNNANNMNGNMNNNNNANTAEYMRTLREHQARLGMSRGVGNNNANNNNNNNVNMMNGMNMNMNVGGGNMGNMANMANAMRMQQAAAAQQQQQGGGGGQQMTPQQLQQMQQMAQVRQQASLMQQQQQLQQMQQQSQQQGMGNDPLAPSFAAMRNALNQG